MSPSTDRFQPPTAHEEQEWILCDKCESAQAVVRIGNKYLCEDCAEKEIEE